MRVARLVALASLVVVLTSSGALLYADDDKPKDLIVGKWEPVKAPEGAKLIVEFTKDGMVKITGKVGDKDFNFTGTYKFTDDNNMEREMTINGKKDTKKTKVVKISKDELVTHDEGDKDDEKFKRVK